VVFTRSAAAIACPPSSPSELKPRLRFVSVVFTRSAAAIACPPPSRNSHWLRSNTVTLHNAFKPLNLSCSPAPLGNLTPLLLTTNVSSLAFSTAAHIVFDVRRSTKVLFAGSIL